MKTSNADLYDSFMTLGERPHVSREQELLTNRIIWFNEFDKQHTFSRKFPGCRVNMVLVGHHKARGTSDQVPLLLLRYYDACRERMQQREGQEQVFEARERFLQAWQSVGDSEDLEKISSSTARFFDAFAAKLRKLVMSSPCEVGPMEQSSVLEIGPLDESEDVLRVDVEIKFKAYSEWARETVKGMVDLVVEFLKAEEGERDFGVLREYAVALGIVDG